MGTGVRGHVDSLCAGESDVVACLRALPASELAEYENEHVNVLEQLGAAHVDGSLLRDHPVRLLASGAFRKVPLLLGTNAHEASFLEQWGAATGESREVTSGLLLGLVLALMYPDSYLAILGHYGLPPDDQAQALLYQILDDSWFHCPARALARAAAAAAVPVFLYSFELPPATHTLELDYIFGWPDGQFSKVFREQAVLPPEPGLIDTVQGYWLQFARGADPDGPGAPAWPQYRAPDHEHLRLDRTSQAENRFGEAHCDFWDSLLATPRLP